jgi:hypothetical protein
MDTMMERFLHDLMTFVILIFFFTTLHCGDGRYSMEERGL